MGKYADQLVLKKTKARTSHGCAACGGVVVPGEYYYKETMADRFLQFLRSKSFCTRCFETHGEALIDKFGSRAASGRGRTSRCAKDRRSHSADQTSFDL